MEAASVVEIGQPICADTLQRLHAVLAQSRQQDGARLPSERALAGRLGVSRGELRKAMMVLELEGQITRHVGRGTYLCAPDADAATAISQRRLMSLAERTAPHEAMNARLVLEPQLAGLAATNATPLHLRQARQLAQHMREAATWDRYEALDFAFHDLIAEAAGNPLLHELYKVVNTVRQVVVWKQLSQSPVGPTPDYHSFAEHDAIVAALEGRDRAGAKAAMQAHLNGTLNAMTSED
jgi:DNA-binding FadR family transcriptional regulator